MSENMRPDEPENPYAAPSLVSMESDVDVSETSSRRELQAFVGPKASYYLRKWAPALEGNRRDTGFNWAAFFLCGLWIAYRKMYVIAFVVYGVAALESLLEDFLFVRILGEPEPPASVDRLITLGISIICGVYGNRWYLSHTRKMVAETKAQGLQDKALLYALSKRGGTSLLASLGLFLLFCVTVFFTVFLFEAVSGL